MRRDGGALVIELTKKEHDAIRAYVEMGIQECKNSGGTRFGIFDGGWAHEALDGLLRRATIATDTTEHRGAV